MSVLPDYCCPDCRESTDDMECWQGFCSKCLEKKYLCEECFQIHDNQKELIEEKACIDGYCSKIICRGECKFICDACYSISSAPDRVKRITSTRYFLCNECIKTNPNVKVESSVVWYGISIAEHHERYRY